MNWNVLNRLWELKRNSNNDKDKFQKKKNTITIKIYTRNTHIENWFVYLPHWMVGRAINAIEDYISISINANRDICTSKAIWRC